MKENAHPGKWQKKHNKQITEQKMQTMEISRKITPWILVETVHPENGRMENAHLENDKKILPQKMTEKACPENERMENARHGK